MDEKEVVHQKRENNFIRININQMFISKHKTMKDKLKEKYEKKLASKNEESTKGRKPLKEKKEQKEDE